MAADPIEGAPLGKLVESFVHVHRVTAARAPVFLEVGRRDQLARNNALADPRRDRFEHAHRAIGELLALCLAPTALQVRWCVLHDRAHDMALIGRKARVDECGDQGLDHRRLTHLAVLACIEGLLDAEHVVEDDDATAQECLRRWATPCGGEVGETIEQEIQLCGDPVAARGAQAATKFGAGRLDAEQVEECRLWVEG